jgi:hypothetical protein
MFDPIRGAVKFEDGLGVVWLGEVATWRLYDVPGIVYPVSMRTHSWEIAAIPDIRPRKRHWGRIETLEKKILVKSEDGMKARQKVHDREANVVAESQFATFSEGGVHGIKRCLQGALEGD